MHPEVELIGGDEHGVPVPGAHFYGIGEGRRYLAGLREVLEKPVVHFQGLQPSGDRVIAEIVIGGTLRTTERHIEFAAVQSIEFQDGLIRRIHTHRRSMDEMKRKDWPT
jgi:hypothetical protein